MYEQQKQLRGGVIGAGVAMTQEASGNPQQRSEIAREVEELEKCIYHLQNASDELVGRLERGGVVMAVNLCGRSEAGPEPESSSPMAAHLRALRGNVERIHTTINELYHRLAV